MRIIKTLSLKKAIAQLALFLVAFVACQPDNEILNSIDTQNVNSESASAALINETSDIAMKVISAMTNSQYGGARDTTQVLFFSFQDSRLTDATVTLYRKPTAVDSPAGQIIIDFKSGATDDKLVIRKGQIKFTYAGQRWSPGSFYKMELINFFRNSVHVDGIDSARFTGLGPSNDTLQLVFNSYLNFGKITFTDGQTVERTDTLTKTWIRFIDIDKGKIDPEKGEWHVNGSGHGVNKFGQAIDFNITGTSELVYSLSCWKSDKVYIPFMGEKIVTVGSVSYTVEYGSGTCDNQITVKLNNGKKKDIIVTGTGN